MLKEAFRFNFALDNNPFNPQNLRHMKIHLPPSFLEQVDVIIEANLDNESFSTEALSASLFLSSSQVYRKIKQQTGQTPSEYIRNTRLNYAKELIESSELRLSEITFMVGFSRLSYFSRCFSNYFGFPPSSLRY